MSVKIVHAADFHLDSAFGALSAEQARQRRRESRELLTRLCNYVNQNGVDIVLLAGDLFDSDTTYRETLEALSEALGAMQARVFIAPGNHDPLTRPVQREVGLRDAFLAGERARLHVEDGRARGAVGTRVRRVRSGVYRAGAG